MAFIDDQIDDYMAQDALGLFDNDENEPEFNDSFIRARLQAPSHPGAIDWRYERGGVFGEK